MRRPNVQRSVPLVRLQNVVLIVHLPLAARVALQVLVWAKFPVVAMLEIVSAVLRLLVSVKITGAQACQRGS